MADRDAAHGATVAKADQIDFHIESTPIDLGLIQGFTTALTNVTGTLQAKIDITGSAADPHPNGVVSIDKAAFTVAPTGVSYTQPAGHDRTAARQGPHHADLGPRQPPELAVAHRRPGRPRAAGRRRRDLRHRERLQGDRQQDGQRPDQQRPGDRRRAAIAARRRRSRRHDRAHQPRRDHRARRRLGVCDQRSRVPDPGGSRRREATPPPAPSIFDALAMDVRLTVPDDLVVRASELRTPGSPISLGAMNITLGGDMRATKEPRQQIALVGAVNTVRGNYDFQGRRFEILRDGTIRFDNAPLNEMDPLLDIRTRRMIQGVEARVNVRGTLKQPEIVLTSTPPLEQADILSLIVFNQPINSLGEGQQISLVAARAAAGDRRGRRPARAVDRQRARPRHVRDQHGAGERRRRRADHRPAARPEPLREGAAGHRRPEPDQLHPRVRAHQLAAAADQRAAGQRHAAVAVPARRRAAASICCSSSATDAS